MGKDYDIAKTAGTCAKCGRVLEEGQAYIAALAEQGEQLERQDWCVACWDESGQEESDRWYGQWRTSVPVREKKKRLFVDNAMLENLFHRLQDDPLEARVNFRFVLALVLMRKKRLVYEGSARDDSGREVWTMRPKGREVPCEVVNPQLDADKIAAVSEQLSEILQGEL